MGFVMIVKIHDHDTPHSPTPTSLQLTPQPVSFLICGSIMICGTLHHVSCHDLTLNFPNQGMYKPYELLSIHSHACITLP